MTPRTSRTRLLRAADYLQKGKRTKAMDDEDRIEVLRDWIFSRCEPIPHSGCWVWAMGISSDGYSHFQINKQQGNVHRLSYEAFKGPIPEGLVVDHLCRVKSCVNPAHLEAVTPRENTLRGLTGKLKKYCARGHLRAGKNIQIVHRSDGRVHQHCRICTNEASRKYKKRKAQHGA